MFSSPYGASKYKNKTEESQTDDAGGAGDYRSPLISPGGYDLSPAEPIDEEKERQKQKQNENSNNQSSSGPTSVALSGLGSSSAGGQQAQSQLRQRLSTHAIFEPNAFTLNPSLLAIIPDEYNIQKMLLSKQKQTQVQFGDDGDSGNGGGSGKKKKSKNGSSNAMTGFTQYSSVLLQLKWVALFTINFIVWSVLGIEWSSNSNELPDWIIAPVVGISLFLLLLFVIHVIIELEIRARKQLFFAYLPLQVIIMYPKKNTIKSLRFWFFFVCYVGMFILTLFSLSQRCDDWSINDPDKEEEQDGCFGLYYVYLGITNFISLILSVYNVMENNNENFILSFQRLALEMSFNQGKYESKNEFQKIDSKIAKKVLANENAKDFLTNTKGGKFMWKTYLTINGKVMSEYVKSRRKEISDMMESTKAARRYEQWVYSRNDIEVFLEYAWCGLANKKNDDDENKDKESLGSKIKYLRWAYGLPTDVDKVSY